MSDYEDRRNAGETHEEADDGSLVGNEQPHGRGDVEDATGFTLGEIGDAVSERDEVEGNVPQEYKDRVRGASPLQAALSTGLGPSMIASLDPKDTGASSAEERVGTIHAERVVGGETYCGKCGKITLTGSGIDWWWHRDSLDADWHPEACAWTLKATANEIAEHLLTKQPRCEFTPVDHRIADAIANVLIDRGHPEETVGRWVKENGQDWTQEQWDDLFGPAADRMAEAMLLPPYPPEEPETSPTGAVATVTIYDQLGRKVLVFSTQDQAGREGGWVADPSNSILTTIGKVEVKFQ